MAAKSEGKEVKKVEEGKEGQSSGRRTDEAPGRRESPGQEERVGREEIMPGTLDLLILKTLARGGELHGYEIARAIQQVSEDVLQVEEGSLYPALQRMLIKGWVKAEWGATAENRRARYYRLTAGGKKQLEAEVSQFERVIGAVKRVIQTA